jgi:hypothetical protein
MLLARAVEAGGMNSGKGGFDNAVTNVLYDVVSFNGSSYVATQWSIRLFALGGQPLRSERPIAVIGFILPLPPSRLYPSGPH